MGCKLLQSNARLRLIPSEMKRVRLTFSPVIAICKRRPARQWVELSKAAKRSSVPPKQWTTVLPIRNGPFQKRPIYSRQRLAAKHNYNIRLYSYVIVSSNTIRVSMWTLRLPTIFKLKRGYNLKPHTHSSVDLLRKTSVPKLMKIWKTSRVLLQQHQQTERQTKFQLIGLKPDHSTLSRWEFNEDNWSN